MNTLWSKILSFLGKLIGINKPTEIPPEVIGADKNLEAWWAIYRCKAPWLDYNWVDARGTKRTRRRKSLNMAKVVTSELAGLVFAEAPEVTAGDLVDQVIKAERLWDNLKKTTEYQAALGGQVIKVCIEAAPAPQNARIGLDFVKAMNFVPTDWDNASIREGVFIDRRVVGKKTLVHLETHKRATDAAPEGQEGPARTGYLVTHKVFDEQTETEVPLDQFDKSLVPQVFVPIERPLFHYFRNPEANNIDPESPGGIAIFANALDTLEALDLAFDGMKTEVLMGRQRIALPSNVMRGYMDPETNTRRIGFDPTDEAFFRLEGDDGDKLKPIDLSGQLRMEQYRGGLQTLLDLLSVQCGFSAGYFSFDGTSVKTATEVISDNSKTFKTMAAFREGMDEGLKHIFSVINELGTLYQVPGAAAEEPNLVWDDSVIESRDARAEYWAELKQNKLTDTVTALKAVHGIDDKAAVAMAAKIKEENTIVVDPLPGFGAGE